MNDNSMVNFPGEGDSLRDSHEGGLYVMLVVPDTETTWEPHCSVDVRIYLTEPDVCVSSKREEVWESPKVGFNAWTVQHDLAKHLRQANELAWQNWVFQAMHRTELSHPMLAAVHLGSTESSLYDERMGQYWQATADDLTESGKALCEALKAAYGVEPLLLTFLDT